jgi:hypothetical protein
MAGLPKVSFNKGEGGLGRPLPGKDHISGLIFYFLNANLPTGFATTDMSTRVKTVYSLEGAEALGILEAGANTTILWYHVKEYFRTNPKGQLWIYLCDNTSVDYDEPEELQRYAEGVIRQIGVFDLLAFVTGSMTTLQASAAVMDSEFMPCEILYAADMQALTLGALTDLGLLSNENVSLVIGEDGTGAGAALAISEATSITTLGATLGTVSSAKVNQSIGYKKLFDLSDGTELEVPAFATGTTVTLYKDQAVSLRNTLHDNGYIFLVKDVGFPGVYHNGDRTAVATTSDFASIRNNRTINKAQRNVRVVLLPEVNGELFFNADGTLSEDTIAFFKTEAARPLVQMQRDGEISAFSVAIDPTQASQSTGQLELTVKIVPVGVAEEIVVNIGFALTTD